MGKIKTEKNEKGKKNYELAETFNFQKTDNLQYYNLGCWVDCLRDQASDGSSIILID